MIQGKLEVETIVGQRETRPAAIQFKAPEGTYIELFDEFHQPIGRINDAALPLSLKRTVHFRLVEPEAEEPDEAVEVIGKRVQRRKVRNGR